MMLKEAICSTLEDYAEAYCAKDIDSLMHVFDDTDNISVIGTGADELCVGRAAVKDLFLRNFNEATAIKFEWDWRGLCRKLMMPGKAGIPMKGLWAVGAI